MEILLVLLLFYLETVVISSLLAATGISKIIKNINQKRYKLIYRDEKQCKENISSNSLFKDLLIPVYNLFLGITVFIGAHYKKKFNETIFKEAKKYGSIDKMTPEEYTRYLNNPNIITSARISRDYYKKLKKAHKIKVEGGVIYFEIKNNNLNIIKSVGKVSKLSEEEQIDLIYENNLFYKDIFNLNNLEYTKEDIKDKLFLKEKKSNVLIHENKLKCYSRLDKINDTKNLLKQMKNDILLLELNMSKKERKIKSKKLMKTFK